MPPGDEAWQTRPDEPAPIHQEREHGLESAQTPEPEIAHPVAPSEEPSYAAPAASAGESPAEQPQAEATPEPQGESEAPSEGPAQSTEETQATAAMPWERDETAAQESRDESGSRVSVVDEQPPRPAPPDGASEEEYRWHTYTVYPSGRPDAVEFIDVYKAFGRARILRGLNMGLPEGMVSMVLGPSGTGKSVCIKHIVGLLYPDEGDILVHGDSVPNMPDDDLFEMRKKFGLLFQDGALFGSMNLYDNVAFPLRQHTEKGEDEIEDIVMRRLNEVGLGDAREKMPNELSGGMRKRAGFARALVLEPDIVMFDEPDSGLDPVRTALLGELILEIHRDMMDEAKAKQKAHLPTFAVITHDIMSARRVADYINVLWKGRIVEAGPAEDMLNSENPFIRQFLSGESQGPLTMD
jgi:phospholipid/cholesterol/gamma-HCH transport system ATP-binding protein